MNERAASSRRHRRATRGPSITLAGCLGVLAALPAAGNGLGFDADPANGEGPDSLAGWTITQGATRIVSDGATDDVARNGNGYALDDQLVHAGTRSLRLEPTAARALRLSRRIDTEAIAGDRIRITAHARRDPIRAAPDHVAGDAQAELWVRISGQRGLLYIGRVGLAPAASGRWERYALDAPMSTQARQIEFGVSARGDTIWVDSFSIESLAAADLPAPSLTATRYVEHALDLMQANSLRRTEIDWPAFRAAAREQARGARSAEDAHLAVSFALGELADGHSYFMSPGQMSRLDAPVSNARTGRPPVAPRGRVLDATEGPLAYLLVPGFAGGDQRSQAAFATELQATIRTLGSAGVCGWIVDLRDNRGGNLWPMLVGLGPLLTEGEVGAAVYPNGTRRSFWYRDGKAGLDDYVQLRVHSPHRVADPSQPIAVLIGRATASAGEILAAAFRAEPGSRSFGAPTRGAHTSTQVFPLYDGAALVLAVAATSNRVGEVFSGAIAPDEPVAGNGRGPGTATPVERDPVVAAAARWLGTDAECSPARPD